MVRQCLNTRQQYLAATTVEGIALHMRRARQRREEKYDEETLQHMYSDAGTKQAQTKGHRTRYPGVRWQKKQNRKTGKVLDDGPVDPEMTRGFWRVSFRYKGIFYNVGSGYASEEDAARAFDRRAAQVGCFSAFSASLSEFDFK